MDREFLKASALSVTVFGSLSVAGLLVSGIAFNSLAVVLCALLAAGSSYVGMYAVVFAIGRPDSLFAYRLMTLVNPTMTLLAIAFWIAGIAQLWG